MRLSTDQVQKVAKLANLPLAKEEEDRFAVQLSETLEYVEKLDQVDTSSVEPTSQVTGLVNVTREDVISPSLSQKDALKNAKSTHNGFIMVEAILDAD